MRRLLALLLLSTYPALAQIGPPPSGGGGPCSAATVSVLGCVIPSTGTFVDGSGHITTFQGTNTQTNTTYTVLSGDAGKMVTFNNASPVAVTLPSAATTGFTVGFGTCLQNLGAGTVTITPTTSTVNLGATVALTTGQGYCPISDGTNYAGLLTGIAGAPPEMITATAPSTLTPSQSYSQTGTYTNGPPAALDYSFDGTGCGSSASSPTIGGGTYSWTNTGPSGLGSHTITVCDHANHSIYGTSSAFSVAGTYVGDGDVVSSATAWIGSIAYSAAARGSAAFHVCDTTGGVDVACADLSTDSSTGLLVAATIGGVSCPSSANCKVMYPYDQTGNNTHPADPGIALRPIFVAMGSTYCMQFPGTAGSGFRMTLAGGNIGNPWTISAVAKRTGNLSTVSYLVAGATSDPAQFDYLTTAKLELYAGGTPLDTGTVTDNAYHAVQAISNNTLSYTYVDGAQTGPVAAGSYVVTSPVGFGRAGFQPANELTGVICSAGVWPVAFNNTQQSNMNSNQHSLWGF